MLKFTILVVCLTFVYAEKAAVVYLFDPSGTNGVTGTVTFNKTDDGVVVKGTVKGLSIGKHGFHIHAIGNIGPGCAASGAHFNPHGVNHGAPGDSTRHVGDLGNINVTNANEVTFTITDTVIDLQGEHNIIGRAVVVHELEDDLGTGNNADSLITGNAGGRLACGVIGILDDSSANPVFKSNLLILIAAVLAYGLKALF